jgi:hypothetical protein
MDDCHFGYKQLLKITLMLGHMEGALSLMITSNQQEQQEKLNISSPSEHHPLA